MMRYLLNASTETVHAPSDDGSTATANCGSLRYVSEDSIRVVSGKDFQANDGVDRCGNCFEDCGGY